MVWFGTFLSLCLIVLGAIIRQWWPIGTAVAIMGGMVIWARSLS
jgi:hypothetical protein